SVHLCDYPEGKTELINEELERRMEFIMNVVVLGRAARNEANLKVRQPLAEMKVVVADDFERHTLEIMEHLIGEELNVKKVTPVTDSTSLMRYIAKPNFKNIGKGPYKSLMPKIKAHLEQANGNEVKTQLENGGYEITIDDKPVTLKAEDIVLQAEASAEFAVQSQGKLSIALLKTLTPELILEGYAREMVNKIQFMRKDLGFEVVDRIRVGYEVIDTDKKADFEKAVELFGEYVKKETLTLKLGEGIDSNLSEPAEWDINGVKIKLALAKEKVA
ncbi:MAG: hypothetical protein J6Z11_08880, partial [Candidatus Riflebacteria bacterium]|nr:hypothetical protein [Candidatus Riflebacteria bacterium]